MLVGSFHVRKHGKFDCCRMIVVLLFFSPAGKFNYCNMIAMLVRAHTFCFLLILGSKPCWWALGSSFPREQVELVARNGSYISDVKCSLPKIRSFTGE